VDNTPKVNHLGCDKSKFEFLFRKVSIFNARLF